MVAARLFDPAAGRQRIDRYELIGQIASGGMATVFLARLTGVGGFQRFVAIKRLHPHLAGDAEFVEMFLDEARLAARIHHPNVVPILEVGASPLGYYLVMEYIEGDTLARLLARGASQGRRMPVPIALRIALDMLNGLHAAHELTDDQGKRIDLVHRDVSPQNVLVGGDGAARITDFGVARAASRLSATRVGQLKGKIAYMAPEQAQGNEDIDRRADVFSSAIVIWEAMAAKRLFKAQHEGATLSRIMTEPIPVLGRVAPHVRKEISNVVMHALDRRPDSRFPTCAAFAEALEAASQGRDGIASVRELAAFVEETMGTEIAQQRDAVRLWLAHSEPSTLEAMLPGPVPASSVSAAAMSLPDGSRPISSITDVQPPRRSRATLAVAGLLLCGAAAGAFYATRAHDEAALAPAAATPAPLPPAPAAAPPAPAPVPVAQPAPSASSAPAPEPTQAALVLTPPPRAAAGGQRRPAKKKKKEDIPANPYR